MGAGARMAEMGDGEVGGAGVVFVLGEGGHTSASSLHLRLIIAASTAAASASLPTALPAPAPLRSAWWPQAKGVDTLLQALVACSGEHGATGVDTGGVSGGAVLGLGGAPPSGGEEGSAVARTGAACGRARLCGDGCSEALDEEPWLRASALGGESWDGGGGCGGGGRCCPSCSCRAHSSRNVSGCLLDGTAQTRREVLPLLLRGEASLAPCCCASACCCCAAG